MKRFVVTAFLLACPLPALAELSAAEQEYHVKVFDYAMDYSQPGVGYEWKSYGGNGVITPAEIFVSKSKSNCRNFTEKYTVGGVEGTHSAVACKRAGDVGWCVLKATDPLTCALEDSPGLWSAKLPSLGGSGGADVNIGKPAGGIGSVGSPNVDGNVNVDTGSPRRGEKPGETVADTVTGTAGGTAGPATGGAIKWFNDTFR